jgi:Ni,Fe-hydrogenase III large subunit
MVSQRRGDAGSLTMLSTLAGGWPMVPTHRGYPRRRAPKNGWRALGEVLLERKLALLGLWGDGAEVHAAIYDARSRELAVLSHEVVDGHAPSLGVFHPPAIRPERAIRDLNGIELTAAPDRRPWLDHGVWPLTTPLGERPGARPASRPLHAPRPEFLPAHGPSLHQIPVGPVHAGIIEPGHFRFTANGETVVRLEERLGYVHKGIEKLLQGLELEQGARIAARTSGDSTVAYSWAFARAAETALGVEAPPRALALRAVMAECERIANHLGDIGAICNDASFSLMHAECGILREETLRAAAVAFDHRLMMDRIVPGGVAQELSDSGREALTALLRTIRRRFPELVELYDNTASLQDRTVGTGILRPDVAETFAPGGYVGRASGRSFDARRDLPYAPYDSCAPEIPVRSEGDVDARVWIRIDEVRASVGLIEKLLASLPAGPLRVALPMDAGPREATAVVEGFRGDVLVYLRLASDARIERCHLRDPSWFQWPLLEAAIEGNIVADFPLCNKSFNCSYSGHDV